MSEKTQTLSYLELYLDLVKPLPNEIQRHLLLVRHLDDKVEVLKGTIREKRAEIERLLSTDHPDNLKDLTTLVLQLHRHERDVFIYIQEKQAVIDDARRMLANFLIKADSDLAHFSSHSVFPQHDLNRHVLDRERPDSFAHKMPLYIPTMNKDSREYVGLIEQQEEALLHPPQYPSGTNVFVELSIPTATPVPPPPKPNTPSNAAGGPGGSVGGNNQNTTSLSTNPSSSQLNNIASSQQGGDIAGVPTMGDDGDKATEQQHNPSSVPNQPNSQQQQQSNTSNTPLSNTHQITSAPTMGDSNHLGLTSVVADAEGGGGAVMGRNGSARETHSTSTQLNTNSPNVPNLGNLPPQQGSISSQSLHQQQSSINNEGDIQGDVGQGLQPGELSARPSQMMNKGSTGHTGQIVQGQNDPNLQNIQNYQNGSNLTNGSNAVNIHSSGNIPGGNVGIQQQQGLSSDVNHSNVDNSGMDIVGGHALNTTPSSLPPHQAIEQFPTTTPSTLHQVQQHPVPMQQLHLPTNQQTGPVLHTPTHQQLQQQLQQQQAHLLKQQMMMPQQSQHQVGLIPQQLPHPLTQQPLLPQHSTQQQLPMTKPSTPVKTSRGAATKKTAASKKGSKKSAQVQAEERLCICRKPSSLTANDVDMIACDKEGCPYQWFHFECLGLKPETVPNGEFFCQECNGNGPYPHLSRYGGINP